MDKHLPGIRDKSHLRKSRGGTTLDPAHESHQYVGTQKHSKISEPKKKNKAQNMYLPISREQQGQDPR